MPNYRDTNNFTPPSQKPCSKNVNTIKTIAILIKDTKDSRKPPGRSINALNRPITRYPNLNCPNIQAKIGNAMNKAIGDLMVETHK